jgi:hypothetical protein
MKVHEISFIFLLFITVVAPVTVAVIIDNKSDCTIRILVLDLNDNNVANAIDPNGEENPIRIGENIIGTTVTLPDDKKPVAFVNDLKTPSGGKYIIPLKEGSHYVFEPSSAEVSGGKKKVNSFFP